MLHTADLTLRPLTADDAPSMYNNWTWDERVARFCRWYPHTDLSQTEQLLQNYLTDGNPLRWGIEWHNELIGMIDVVNADRECATLGYVLSHDYWNRGFMSQALAAVIEHLFSCGFSAVAAEHHAENGASGRVMEKCGMRFIGTRTTQRKFGSEETCLVKCYRIDAIGLKRRALSVVSHRPCWARLAQAEIDRLKAALGKSAVDIQHVGSTAIPHIMAKPIIDLAVGTTDMDSAIVRLTEAGATCHGEEVADEIFFTEGYDDVRTFHIHLCQFDGKVWKDYLNFRDYLTARPEKAAEYEVYKRDAITKYDRVAYTANKQPLVERFLREAAQWR